jgi:hypothetical protein
VRTAAQIAELVWAGAVPNLAFLSIGLWALRALLPSLRGAERYATAYALGAGIASLAVLVLRGMDVPLPLGALALVGLSGVPLLRDRKASSGSSPAPALGWIRAVRGFTLAIGGVMFVAALAPETYWDGFEYHLPIARAWSEGPIRALPAMVDAEFRAGIDLLYVPALAAGQPDAAASVSACFALALALLVGAEAGRRASPGAGALTALFVLIVPLVTAHATSSYVDIGVGVFGFLALLGADRWNRSGSPADLTHCALFAAFAVNAKPHAALLLPAVAVVCLAGGRNPGWRAALPRLALYAACVLPWFVKSALTTGNPFFPLWSEWLGAGASSPGLLELRRFRLSTDFPWDRNPTNLLRYLAAIHVGGNPHVSGLLGPLPLALAPLAGFRATRSSWVLGVVLLALFGLQFAYMPALRFGIPIVAFLALAAACGGVRLAAAGSAHAVSLGALLAVLAVHQFAGTMTHYAPRVAALQDPAVYSAREFPDQVALVEMVRRAEPAVGIPKGAVLWMPKPVYNLHWERNGELFLERATPAAAREILNARGVRSLVLDVEPASLRAGRTGRAPVDAWLLAGSARLHVDSPPPRARGSRVWVRVDLD